MNKLWWEKNPNWQTNTIPTSGDKRSKNSWLMAAILCGFSVFVIYSNQQGLLNIDNAEQYMDIKQLILVALSLFFLAKAVLDTLKLKRFGKADFIMHPFPTFLGKKFSGSVQLNDKVDANMMQAELLLMQRRRIAMGEKNAYRQYLAWKMPLQLSVEHLLNGSRILVDGKIPHDKPPSQEAVGESHYWQLYIYSQDKSYKSRWDVPVLGADDHR
ncbi:MAG: hypothetical protein AAFZ92_10790 [Pseudomonadota bacterium]